VRATLVKVLDETGVVGAAGIGVGVSVTQLV
jgi:hypothetical protein